MTSRNADISPTYPLGEATKSVISMKIKPQKVIHFFGGVLAGVILTFTLYAAFQFPGIFRRLRYQRPRKHSPLEVLQRTHQLLQNGRNPHRASYLKREASQNFLPVVVASQNDSTGTFKAVKDTWGGDCLDWLVTAGDVARVDLNWLEEDYENLQHVIVASECMDFSMDGELSRMNILCLLKAIYRTSLDGYQWLVIMPSHTYLSVNNLNKFLTRLAPSLPFYIGKPTTYCDERFFQIISTKCIQYCDLEYPLILSQAALRNIMPHLAQCLLTQAEGIENGSISGGIALGYCMNAVLMLSCSDSLVNSLVNPLELFLPYSSHSWLQGSFVSLSHVPTYSEMLSVHVHILSIDMWTSIGNVRHYSQLVHRACSEIPDCNMTAYDHQVLVFEGAVSYDNLPKITGFKRLYNLLRWEHVDLENSLSYISKNTHPFRKIVKSEMQKLDFAIQQVLKYLHGNRSLSASNVDIQDVYLRQTGYRGLEIIADIQFQTEKPTLWRCYLAMPHSSGITYVKSVNTEPMDKTMIEFMVPISNVNKRLVRFLHMYVDLCLVNKEPCSLNLVVYGKEDADLVRGHFSSLKEKYVEANLNLIEAPGTFSRGRALHYGINQLNNNPLIFICDVDMIIKQGFLRRCQRNAIKNEQVYYPEFFKYYDMNYVYKLEDKPSGFRGIERKHGHWAAYSFGMVCLYKSDYLAAGGFDLTISGWGGEDTAFAKSLMMLNLELFKVPDPALLHEFHDKTCSIRLTTKQLSDCISSRKESIADKIELARYVLHLEEKCPKSKWRFWEW